MGQMFLGLSSAKYIENLLEKFYTVGKKHIWNLATVPNLDSLTSCNSLVNIFWKIHIFPQELLRKNAIKKHTKQKIEKNCII